MPQKGWANLCVRKETAEKLMRIAEANGLTIDELLVYFDFMLRVKALLRQKPKEKVRCKICGKKVRLKDWREHVLKCHAEDIAKSIPIIPDFQKEAIPMMYEALYGRYPYGRREAPHP